MMTLWFAMMMLCSATVVAIAYPLIRRYEATNPISEEQAVYQDQLKEVERDFAAGTIEEAESKAAKAEIQRRLEFAARAEHRANPVSNSWKLGALIATVGLVILGGVNIYAYMGSPNVPSALPQTAQLKDQGSQQNEQQAASNAAGQATVSNQVDQMIGKLRQKLNANPNNAEGWRMLGWALFSTQKYDESVEAYGKALAIDPNNVDYKSALAESVIQAAQGTVTPKAQDLINEVLAKSPKDLRARFYDALGHEQSGDQQGALDRWSALLADAPADAGWRDDVKQRISDLGKVLGKDVSGILNVPPAAPAAATGSDEKNAMLAGMISKLAQKLAANPKDREGWTMMIRSLIIIGDKKGADEALAKALDIFKDDPATQNGLKQAATEAAQKVATMPGGADVNAAAASSAAPAISTDQQAAIQAMPAQDQQAMIQGMVQKLADRLKDNPKDLEGWTRLMRAYTVMNLPDKAKAARDDALKAFEGDQTAIDQIGTAAKEFGIN